MFRSKTRNLENDVLKSKALRPGQGHYRAYIGPPKQYDFMGATQFALMFRLGIREEHKLLDIGCGSLRCGKYMLQFLLPNRYYGVEPNEWLWKDAVKKEVGKEIIEIKRPVFSSNDNFEFGHLDSAFDFIVAQSIFSHTGHDLFEKCLRNAAQVMNPRGQFLFTVLDETVLQYDFLKDSSSKQGWVYPECVVIEEKIVQTISQGAGLHIQALNWFHPRQHWYRAVLSEDLLLTPEQLGELGSGKPLLDDRF